MVGYHIGPIGVLPPPPVVGGQVVFDAKSTAPTATGAVTSVSHTNLTIGSGSNRALLALFEFKNAPPTFTSGPTWNGVLMTAVSGAISAPGGNQPSCVIYGLVNPASGNNTLAAGWAVAQDVYCEAVSFTGVNQTSVAVAFPHGAGATAVGTSPASVTITSAVGNLVVAIHGQMDGVWGAISGTTLFSSTALSENAAANYDNGAASVTLSGAFSAPTNTWASAGCDILAA